MNNAWTPSQLDIPRPLRKVLLSVEKPARYIGGEWNSVLKDWNSVDARMVLAFPDVYEIGMSFLGYRILYHILNSDPRFLAERAYSPWPDMEKSMRENGIPAHSLESFTPLSAFDVVGITLQTEMAYGNVLTLLELGGIPLSASDRTDKDPLVVAGGPCSFNPEPYAEFFDAVLLGDGEEAVAEMLALVGRMKKEGAPRKRILEELAGIPGYYVPSLYDVTYKADGTIESVKPNHPNAPAKVSKRTTKDLDDVPYPTKPILPTMDIVHDRIQLEVFRGCTRGCRFCQAGMTYRPVRERSADKLLETAKEAMANSGYEEISLTSLSTADYSRLDDLVNRMADQFTPNNVAISSGSLRVDSKFDKLFNVINRVKKTGFTFAPEAGTDRMRRIINKTITEVDILSTMEKVFSNGWDLVKLYFMFGLPLEKQEDLQGILDLVSRIKAIGRKVGGAKKQVHPGISCFVPKPFTPFQWCAQGSLEEIAQKHEFLCRGLKFPKRENVEHVAKIEALLALGDRRVSKVIRRAWEKGARFDGWTDQFKPKLWYEACAEVGVDWKYYTDREKPREEVLPWDHLFLEMSKDFLWYDWELSLKVEEREDCRWDACLACGVCEPENGIVNNLKETHLPEAPAAGMPPPYQDQKMKVRIRFVKEGRARYLSHLTVVRVFQRALNRLKVPLSYTGGFSRRPRTSFSPPTSLGVESACDAADLVLYQDANVAALEASLRNEMPPGLQVISVEALPLDSPAAGTAFGSASYEVSPEEYTDGPALVETLQKELADFLAAPSRIIKVVTEKGTRTKDVRLFVKNASVGMSDGQPLVRMDLDLRSPHSTKLELILRTALPSYDWEPSRYRARRTRLEEDKAQETVAAQA